MIASLSLIEPRFTMGQKVWCYYHVAAFFKPPMCGTVILKLFRRKHHMAMPYEGFKNYICDWYLVKMGNGLLALYPASCMKGIYAEIEEYEKMADSNFVNDEAWQTLTKWQEDRLKFIEE